MTDQEKEVLPVVHQAEILESKEFQFGHTEGRSTRLAFIGLLIDGIVVTYWTRKGKVDASWIYLDMEERLAERMYYSVIQADSVGKQYNELFFSGRKPLFKGEKVQIGS